MLQRKQGPPAHCPPPPAPLPCQLCLCVSVLSPSPPRHVGGGLRCSDRPQGVWRDEATFSRTLGLRRAPCCSHQASRRLGGFCSSRCLKAFPLSASPPAHLASLCSGHRAWSLSVSPKPLCLLGSLVLGHPCGPVPPSPPSGLLAGPQVTC